MDDEQLIAALKELEDTAARSESARLRAAYPYIERCLEAGVRRTTILETLHRHGFSMELSTFDNSLYRIRKKLGKGRSRQKVAGVITQSAPTASSTSAHVIPGLVSGNTALDAKSVLGDLARTEGGFSPIPKATSFEIDETEKGKK